MGRQIIEPDLERVSRRPRRKTMAFLAAARAPKLMKPREVVMARDDGFITLADRKLLDTLLSMVSRLDATHGSNSYALSVRAVMEVLDIRDRDRLLSSLGRLAETAVMIDYLTDEGEKVVVRGHYLSYAMAEDKGDCLEVSFDSIVRKFLSSPKIYGMISLRNVMEFRSSHALRLYEILALYARRKHPVWRVSVAEFREVMSLQGKHDRIDNFIDSVLRPALQEVTDVGRRPVSVELSFKRGEISHLTFRVGALMPVEAQSVMLTDEMSETLAGTTETVQ